MASFADVIIEENIELIRNALRYGIDVNQIDEYGFTPLIEAAIVDNIEIAELLIRHGADVNLQDSLGNTALHWAAENNDLRFCELLIQHRAEVNAYNFAGQPVLVMPFLRQQTALKKLLLNHGADLDFTQDYINTKLLGHMYELVGTADIVDPKNDFVEVDFEGFILEVTLAMIGESLAQFANHFAARQLRRYVNLTHVIIDVIYRAAQLIKYQQYRTPLARYQSEIVSLIQQEPLIIPIGYEGHAITLVKMGEILVKCDRREDSRLYDNVTIFHMDHASVMDVNFIQKLLYEKLSDEFVNVELERILGMRPVTELKIAAQVSGNCSWANVEACIPVLFFLLFGQAEGFYENIPRYKNLALNFFNQWRDWNKGRSLHFCIQSFEQADKIRKACKAEILAAILFQTCNGGTVADEERAALILAAIGAPAYSHVLQNYIRSYCYEDFSEEGQNFLRLLKKLGYVKK